MSAEFGLIRKFAARLGTPHRAVVGIGDDAAVIKLHRDGYGLLASDMIIEGVHFRRRISRLEDIGWKALAVALSDLAAMGGKPAFATVSMGLPSTRDGMPLFEGLAACAETFRVDIVGGDTSRSPGPLILDVAVFGETGSRTPVLRRGARPGDLVCVTGTLGKSALGLRLAEEDLAQGPHETHPGTGDPVDPQFSATEREVLLAAHRRPIPRIEAGQALAAAGAHAMIDVSDGLAGDARHLADASGVALVLRADRIPIPRSAWALAARWGVDPLHFALGGGEDFEILACVPPKAWEAARSAAAFSELPLTVIGHCEQGSGVWLLRGGRREPAPHQGWEHFRNEVPAASAGRP